MYIDKTLGQKIESAHALSHQNYTTLCGHHLKLSTGGAFFAGSDDFFTQVIGWGFNADIKELDSIEAFYQSHQAAKVAIEYCTLAPLSLCEALMDRGYRIKEWTNVSIKNDLLANEIEFNDTVKVKQNHEGDLAHWAEIVSTGFNCPEHLQTFLAYAKSSGVTTFSASIDENEAGGGAIAIHQGIADLGMTSTLDAFRGQGVQKALIQARLIYAKENNVDLALVITEPGSISDNNIRKMGFDTVYSRFKLEKSLS